MSNLEKKLSIIIPTKNEAECLPFVIDELLKVAGRFICEIIVVDAASPDGTATIAKELGCIVLQQPTRGYGEAVGLGLSVAKGKYICFFDADGSYDPMFLVRAIDIIAKDNLDAVVATRYHKLSGSEDDTLTRRIGNFIFTFLMRFWFKIPLSDSLHLYLIVKNEIARSLPMRGNGFEYCIEFVIELYQNTTNIIEIPSLERARLFGESKVNAIIDGIRILIFLVRLKFDLQTKAAKGIGCVK